MNTYKVHNLAVQPDGSSCGWWVLTCALLLVCGVSPETVDTKKTLRKIGVSGIKELWERLWIDWRTNSTGLCTELLMEFLSQFSDRNCLQEGVLHVAERPSWISQYVPGQPSQTEIPAFKNADESSSSSVLRTLNKQRYAGIMAGIERLSIENQHAAADDLKRLEVGRWINDEIINMWRQVMLVKYEMTNSSDGTTTWIFTTFSYPKIKYWYDNLDKKESSALFSKLRKWYKDINLSGLDECYFPVHLREEGHWILAKVSFTQHHIILYDSWGPTQKKNADIHKAENAEGVQTAQILCTWAGKEAELRQMSNPSQWDLIPAGFSEVAQTPIQDNTYDCGVFVMIYLQHFLELGQINNFDPNAKPGNDFATKLFCSAENIFNLRKAILNGILNHAEITPIPACKFLQIYAIEKLMKLIQWSWNPSQWNLSSQKFLIVKLVNQSSPWIVILVRLRTKRNSVVVCGRPGCLGLKPVVTSNG
ncbi:hypothetical protein CPB83DRAFT_165821 [Crepidotus variabilis]|uniref:Ubiquitin-like protease family profile domain-containing protein n=1 Tax=Crepidotus variabilis TaxID=179855 RepID=A0A9P6EKL8_9AGAR|nr:hypothetical protein CPB83DRAFT_165821 [Crepidotus variabilis]